MLSTLPDFMKWYLSVFETVFMAGAVGVADRFIILLKELSSQPTVETKLPYC
jgi:hypothetical protein